MFSLEKKDIEKNKLGNKHLGDRIVLEMRILEQKNKQ